MADVDSGLVKRGLLLFGMMSALVGVILVILWQRPSPRTPTAKVPPELAVTMIAHPVSPFPASLTWPAVWQLSDALPSPVGWEIRYNATSALARKGSANVPWSNMLEMLDEDRQSRNFHETLRDGKQIPDENAARAEIVIALNALMEWHKKWEPKQQQPQEMQAVYAAVDRLAQSNTLEVRTQAAKALEELSPFRR